MPRHTHPRPRLKHPRALVRYQRQRYIRKRWRFVKQRYADDFLLTLRLSRLGLSSDDELRLLRELGQAGPVVFFHPELVRRTRSLDRRLRWWLWPITNRPGYFERNQFTTASWAWDAKKFDPRRAREKREWRRDISDDVRI